jgi:hypothetical protein
MRVWRGSPRWPYVVLAVLACPFIGMAYEDAGPYMGGIYAAITVLGLLQAGLPTTLGWSLFFLVLETYAVGGLVEDWIGGQRHPATILWRDGLACGVVLVHSTMEGVAGQAAPDKSRWGGRITTVLTDECP